MFGYSASEMRGRSLTMLMPDGLRRHEASLARYLATGREQGGWQAVELVARHRSGREIPVEISFGESSKGLLEPGRVEMLVLMSGVESKTLRISNFT